MNTFHDYESMGTLDFKNRNACVLETYSGTSIVAWHGRIERQLVGHLADAEKGRNFPYADKLREFLKIWRSNEIDGSINRETLETLKSAADMLSVDTWNFSSYFSSLRDQLRILIASEEELPRGVDMNQNDPLAGAGGGGGGAPPMSPAFGPEEEPPPGEEDLGVPPPGTEGGAPGEEGAPAPGEEGSAEEAPPGEAPGERPRNPEEEIEHV